MKVVIIGVGGVGTVVAHKCAQHPEVFSEIVLASRTLAKCEAVARAIGKPNVSCDTVDADDVEQVVALFERHKPKMVIKGGFINWAEMGDPNASLPTPQPVIYRPMYGAFGKAMPRTCVRFVSRASVDNGAVASYGVDNIIYAVHGTRQLGKANMMRNTATPRIEVDPETFNVYVDGKLAYVDPAKSVPLGQLYWFS